jgi:predicted dehydrogenase
MAAVKRIALVAAGNMGANHARVISQSDQATLAVLVDPRESVGRDMADRLGAAWAPELPDLHGVDAVVVAAATEAHYGLALEVLNQD